MMSSHVQQIVKGAAIVSLGWYLMAPPQTSQGSYNTGASLSQWITTGGYDDATTCNAERTQRWQSGPAAQRMEAAASACIASDDRRLVQQNND
jgi:hypothetical protein